MDAPIALEKAGLALWSSIAGKYELRPDELAVLANACRAADMIAAVEKAWAEDGRPMYTKGSMGQLVEHPAPKGIRSWQSTMDSALARLKLPEDGAAGVTTSTSARKAASARWSHGA